MCSFWATHVRVAIGKEKTNDTDGIMDRNYQEELGLLRQRGQRGAYLEFEGITVASLSASMPCGNGEQGAITIITWQGQGS